MQELIGKTVGQYQIIEQIGKGGMATIFKAYQPAIDRYVAVKVLPKELAKDPNFVKRFVQEAKAIAALEHSHILPVHDFGTQDDITYMVMRYVPGGTLSDVMGLKLPLDKITKYVGDVARALDYAHKRGVVHRDIKPSNILIDEQGEVLLTDFGVAKMLEGSESTQLTAAGAVLGTPAYMSPEQAQSSEIDGRSDIYSLGVVLYELLTGQPPYQAETPFAIVLKHISEPLPLPRTIDPTIPEPFERVVFKAMAKSPNDRFATAGDMAKTLEKALRQSHASVSAPTPPPALTDETAQVPPVSPTMADAAAAPAAAPAPEKKSGPKLWMAGAVMLVLACITIGCFVFLWGAASDNTADQADPTLAAGGADATALAAEPAEPTAPAAAAAVEATEPPVAAVAEPESDTIQPAGDLPEDETALEEDPALAEADPSASDIDSFSSGDILLEDDFSNNDNEWPEEYLEDELGYYDSSLTEEEEYLVAVGSDTDDGHVVWFEPTMDYLTDFTYSVEATTFTDSESYLYGMVFRSNEDGSAYFFEIDFEGFIVTAIDANDEWTTLIEYTYTEVIDPEDYNELRVEAVGSAFTFFINGEKVATLEDSMISEGTIGVVAEAFEADDEIEAVFDNVLVTVP